MGTIEKPTYIQNGPIWSMGEERGCGYMVIHNYNN
jgi:hypothetical protein